ncbi:hypothetical protein KEM48_007704 [Puccinia striiformis f. sp. tritici PST-130]|nr:hypothetical protein KEM48_007704 [Puccinia striiformis f. sp. tritici PST-130]
MSEGYKQWHLLSVPIEGPWKNPRRLRFISKQLFQSPAPDDMKEEQEAIPERTAGSLEADLGFQTEDHQEEPVTSKNNPWFPFKSREGEILSQRVVWTKCKPAISIQKVA